MQRQSKGTHTTTSRAPSGYTSLAHNGSTVSPQNHGSVGTHKATFMGSQQVGLPSQEPGTPRGAHPQTQIRMAPKAAKAHMLAMYENTHPGRPTLPGSPDAPPDHRVQGCKTGTPPTHGDTRQPKARHPVNSRVCHMHAILTAKGTGSSQAMPGPRRRKTHIQKQHAGRAPPFRR